MLDVSITGEYVYKDVKLEARMLDVCITGANMVEARMLDVCITGANMVEARILDVSITGEYV